MGWSHGYNAEGREVGYAVEAVCDEDGCDVKIDRGLYYCCGDMHGGGEYGCGRYFCGGHLFFAAPEGTVCGECAKNYCPECNSDDPGVRLQVPAWDAGQNPIMVLCDDDEWHS